MMLSTVALACILDASKVNKINPDIILSIILTEGGYSGAEIKNSNGSKDLGLMQINDKTWLGLVSSKIFAGNRKKAYNKLKTDECFNIYVGSWILSNSIRMAHNDLWEGIGRYHSATPKYKYIYQTKVKKKLKYITNYRMKYEKINQNILLKFN